MDPHGASDLSAWSKGLGLSFRDISLLDLALTHRSFAHEAGNPTEQGERLEFLGDSVLGLIISNHIYQNFPRFNEGRLARIRSIVVAEPSLAALARDIGIGPLLRLGRGESMSGGADRSSNLADALESVIGAVFLDCGMEATTAFVLRLFDATLKAALVQADDPKTALQEFVQKKYRSTPRYEVMSSSGPDHEREFECRVIVDGQELARGTGSARRLAEREAAALALKRLAGDSGATDS